MKSFQSPEGEPTYGQLCRSPHLREEIERLAAENEPHNLKLYSTVPPEIVKSYTKKHARAAVIGEQCDRLNMEVLYLRVARAELRVWKLHSQSPGYLRFYSEGVAMGRRMVRRAVIDMVQRADLPQRGGHED